MPSLKQNRTNRTAEELRNLIGRNPGLEDALADALPPTAAIRAIRRAEKVAKSTKRRIQYIQACIDKAERIKELERWLDKHPDPYDVLSIEELREEDPVELKEYCRERSRRETELCVLAGIEPPMNLLGEKIGWELASSLALELASVISPQDGNSAARVERILLAACRSDVKYPVRYLERCIQGERQAVRKSGRARDQARRFQP